MRVLYVNHTGAVSGAERSLLNLLDGLSDDMRACLACPADGPLTPAASGDGTVVVPIMGTDGSLKLHPRETPRALARLSAAALQTARHAHRSRAQLIHANSIRAGLVTVQAASLTGIPAVVHVRDRLPRSPVADLSLRMIGAGARLVIANSRYTEIGMTEVSRRACAVVVHNPVDLRRFDPQRVDREAIRRRLQLPQERFVLGIVGQITPWKGQREAVEMTAALAHAGHDVGLLVIGEPKFVSVATRYDNRAYHGELISAIKADRIGDRVQLMGERADIPQLMAGLDALLVPSWEEPFGRVVIEAMALGIPVIATDVGGPAEIITDGVDGLLRTPRDPASWAAAIAELITSPPMRTRLGQAGRTRAVDFALPRHVARIESLYAEVVG